MEMHTALLETTSRGVESVRALDRLLDDLATTVIALDRRVYCAKVASVVSGSIGEHVRHCLDHVAALVAFDGAGNLSYDARQRGTLIETDPAAAVAQLLRLRTALSGWPALPFDEPVCVASLVSPAETAITWSTLGRELVFVISHTIHHQAIVAVLLTFLDVDVPDRFGVAPSTPRRH